MIPIKYTIKIADDLSTHRIHFIEDDSNGHKHDGNFNNENLTEEYFKHDSNHDKLFGINPNDNGKLKLTYKHYKDRFNQINFMLVDKSKKNQSDYKKIKTNGPTDDVKQIMVREVTPGNPPGDEMKLDKYFKDILKIDLHELTNRPLYTCKTENNVKSFYESLQFFNIYDMGSKFPDDIASPSFIIDSASSTIKLNEVPNICKNKQNNTYDISGFILPDDPTFSGHNNFSLLFYGDLQIAYFFMNIIGLKNIVDAVDNKIVISNNTFDVFNNNTLYTTKKNLISYSILALNIFWQYVLSYVKLYTDLFDKKNNTTDISSKMSTAIRILRHWVYTDVEFKGNTIPMFKGRFFKLCNPLGQPDVSSVARWFLDNHETTQEDVSMYIPDSTNKYGLNVSQSLCAKLINSIIDYMPTGINTQDRALARSEAQIEHGIIEVLKSHWEKNPSADNRYIINLCRILKFTGDKSHQVASILLRHVFKSRNEFKNMFGCINTEDRLLILGSLMDNVPLIITNPPAQIIESLNIKQCDTSSLADKILIGWFIPKGEKDIFLKIEQYFRDIKRYIDMLNELHSINNEFINTPLIKQGLKQEKSNELIGAIKKTLSYILLVYLSFFTFEIDPQLFFSGIHNNITLSNGIYGPLLTASSSSASSLSASSASSLSASSSSASSSSASSSINGANIAYIRSNFMGWECDHSQLNNMKILGNIQFGTKFPTSPNLKNINNNIDGTIELIIKHITDKNIFNFKSLQTPAPLPPALPTPASSAAAVLPASSASSSSSSLAAAPPPASSSSAPLAAAPPAAAAATTTAPAAAAPATATPAATPAPLAAAAAATAAAATYSDNIQQEYKTKFSSILKMYRDVQNSTNEFDFLTKLNKKVLYGYPSDNVLLNEDIEKYYATYKNHKINEPSPDLLTLCNLHNKQMILDDANNQTIYKNIFTEYTPDKLENIKKSPDYYNNIYVNIPIRDQDKLNMYTLIDRISTPNGKPPTTWFFNEQLFKLFKYDNKYYMLPTLKCSLVRDKTDGIINKLDKDEIYLQIKNTVHNRATEGYDIIFKRLSHYINDINSLIELDQSILKGTPNRDEQRRDICNSLQCKLVIFFSLFLFKHETNWVNIKKLQELFKKQISMHNDDNGDKGNFLSSNGEIIGTSSSSSSSSSYSLESSRIDVLGVFSVTSEGSVRTARKPNTRGTTITFEIMSKIDGLYFINKTDLQNSYLDLKSVLQTFLDINKTLNNEEYKNIILY